MSAPSPTSRPASRADTSTPEVAHRFPVKSASGSRSGKPYSPRGTVYGTLLNFRDEWESMAAQMAQAPYKAPPKAPVLYVKTANTWSTSGAGIPVPMQVPEVETGATIGMVIGRRALGAGALVDAVSGAVAFVLMNDLSVPHASFFRPPVRFKCLDGFLGIGDALVDARAAGDPERLRLQVRINGDLRQTVDFGGMLRSAAQLLADVGEFMTLREGDVLMLGCAAGRPLARVGDRIDISAPGMPAFGTLTNSLVADA